MMTATMKNEKVKKRLERNGIGKKDKKNKIQRQKKK